MTAPVSNPPGLIGSSPLIRRLFSELRSAAASDVSVLICGESGTGKGLVAKAIHDASARLSGPFVSVNCAAIAKELIESELFGHVRGAFTGATHNNIGLIRASNGGTLFLDEIGELLYELQAKLLGVLEDGAVRPVGATRGEAVDTRFIAATNCDLRKAVTKGSFREDLYYRLNVVPIRVPPLRKRGNDIRLLTEHFLAHFAKREDLPTPLVPPQVHEVLAGYPWPGNVRELRNVIRRMLLLSDGGAVDIRDLPASLHGPLETRSKASMTLAQVVANHVRRVYEETGANITQTARILDIDRKTVRSKLALANELQADRLGY